MTRDDKSRLQPPRELWDPGAAGAHPSLAGGWQVPAVGAAVGSEGPLSGPAWGPSFPLAGSKPRLRGHVLQPCLVALQPVRVVGLGRSPRTWGR